MRVLPGGYKAGEFWVVGMHELRGGVVLDIDGLVVDLHELRGGQVPVQRGRDELRELRRGDGVGVVGRDGRGVVRAVLDRPVRGCGIELVHQLRCGVDDGVVRVGVVRGVRGGYVRDGRRAVRELRGGDFCRIRVRVVRVVRGRYVRVFGIRRVRQLLGGPVRGGRGRRVLVVLGWPLSGEHGRFELRGVQCRAGSGGGVDRVLDLRGRVGGGGGQRGVLGVLGGVLRERGGGLLHGLRGGHVRSGAGVGCVGRSKQLRIVWGGHVLVVGRGVVQ